MEEPMKAQIATGWVALFLVGAATADARVTSSEAQRLREAATVLTSLHSTPDKDIPEDLWSRAQCVAVIPSVKKVAFVFGGEYGKGVITCKNGENWTAPAFVQLQKGSWGAQLGAQEVDLVLLVMNRRGAEKLMKNKVALGGDASVAAGPIGRTAQASTDIQMNAEILSYSRAHGVFAGIDLSGGVLGPDDDANRNAYGPDATPTMVLVENKFPSPPEARQFMTTVRAEFGARATTGSRP
jgi:SH3 domain-containing YSC84-like protein 1